MKKVFVTGAAGFIRFHATRALLEDGHEIFGMDNLSPYYDVGLKKARLGQLTDLEGFSFEEGDVHDAETVNRVFEAFKPDYVLRTTKGKRGKYLFTYQFI